MKKPIIFLSHSRWDKDLVRRVNGDLKSHGFETWIDEEQILLGGSITEEIQKGLEKSRVTLVFLSEHAVRSKWVQTEWQNKFFEQIQKNKVNVVPVVLDNCRIPKLLSDKLYSDFRNKSKYEESLSILLRDLQKLTAVKRISPATPVGSSKRILETTIDLLDDLESESISLPFFNNVKIIKVLKKMPRSGKKIRIDLFDKNIRARSVYDHLISLAHLADCLFDEVNHGIPAADARKIAFCIAYHELNEIVLGDIPTYTSLTTSRRKATRVHAEQKLRSIKPTERELIANQFVWMFLSEKHRDAFSATIKTLSDEDSNVYVFFKALDKIDPIVAVWRYLHHYRGKLGDTPREFNRQMKDFFENPDVRSYAEEKKMDRKIIDYIINMQDRAKAWEYYENPDRLFGNENLFQLPRGIVRKTIEGISLFMTNSDGSSTKTALGRATPSIFRPGTDS